jgi:FAD/FMN-containing dehydrogenase
MSVDVKTRDGGTARIPSRHLEELKRQLRGDVLTPGDEGYELARRLWNGMIDRRPALTVLCAEPEDIARCVVFAREHSVLLTIRGGGHNVAGSAVQDQGMTMDLSRLRHVDVDPSSRRVRVEAGATLAELDRAAQAHGLAVPVGLVSATGIAGLTLHGGLGWLTRRYGLTVDNLESADLVNADGQPMRASAEENADLFWALHGGGGNFAAVTAFEFRAYPVGPRVWFAAPVYAADRSAEVLGFFREYMATAPDELGAVAVCWSAPEDPRVPSEHWGEPAVILLACYTGEFEKGEEAIEPLRRIGKTLGDLSGPIEYLDAQKFLDADYPDGGLYYWKSLYLENLSEEAIAAISAYASVRPSPESSVDIWALGGVLSRRGNNGGPLVSREEPFLLGIEANWHDRTDNQANIAWTREMHRDMQRFSRGATYLNFPGFGEEGSEMLHRAYGENYGRLQAVKAKYDPDNVFRGQLPIETAGTPGAGSSG